MWGGMRRTGRGWITYTKGDDEETFYFFFPAHLLSLCFNGWVCVWWWLCYVSLLWLKKMNFADLQLLDQITVGHPWCACALHECSLDERQSSTCEAAYRRSRNDIVLKKKNRYTPSNRFLSPLTPPSISPFSLCGLALYKYATATMLPYKYMHTWISSKGTFLFLCSSFFPFSLSHTHTCSYLLIALIMDISSSLTLTQVFQQPIVPLSFLASFLSLGGFFYGCIYTGVAKTEKQISWLLTFASSLVCTIISTPCFYKFWRSGWDIRLLGMESTWHTASVCFFITYLILDLTMGSLYYRRRITFLTGWFHHTLYILILLWFLRLRTASFFCTAAILEVPTLVLALGSLKQSWRCDFLFASSFFVLRLVMHAWMIHELKQHHRVQSLWMVAVVVFPLHLYWFYGKFYHFSLFVSRGVVKVEFVTTERGDVKKRQ